MARRRKKSHGCLYDLFLWPIAVTERLTILLLKLMLYVMVFIGIFCFYLAWYLICGLFKLIRWLFSLILHKAKQSSFKTVCNSGEDYEQICCQKLKQHGFTHIETTPRTGDHGVDILARRAGRKYAIQCKYYASAVGNHAVQEVYSGCSYYDADVAVVLTNNIFTSNAIDEAKKLNVQLWSKDRIPFSDRTLLHNFFKKNMGVFQVSKNQDTIIEPAISPSSDSETIEKEDAVSLQTESHNAKDINAVSTITVESTLKNKLEVDPHFVAAGRFIIEKEQASIGIFQRLFKIGFNRAARILDQLYFAGVVGPEEGTKPRKALMSMEQFEVFLNNTELIETISSSSISSDVGSISCLPPVTDRIQMYNGKYDYMEGHDFEQFCAKLLEANGFCNVRVTQESNDQGIDILAEKLNVKYAVQCKCYSSDVGNKAVQEVFAGKSYYDCHVGVVLTNRYFTRAAKELARKTQVFLWDRDMLEKLIKNTNT